MSICRVQLDNCHHWLKKWTFAVLPEAYKATSCALAESPEHLNGKQEKQTLMVREVYGEFYIKHAGHCKA